MRGISRWRMCETLQDDVKQASLPIHWFSVACRGECYFLGLFLVGLSWELVSRDRLVVLWKMFSHGKWLKGCLGEVILPGRSWACVLTDHHTSQLESSSLKSCTGESSNKKSIMLSHEFWCLVLSEKLVQPSLNRFEYLFCHTKKALPVPFGLVLLWEDMDVVMCGCGACVCLSKSDNTRKLIKTYNCNCRSGLFCGREVFTGIFLALEVKSDPHPALAVFGELPEKLFKRHSYWNMSRTILARSSDRLQMGRWNADLPVTHRSAGVQGAHVAI